MVNTCFDLLVKKILENDNIRTTATGQGDYYPTSCLLDYFYFKKYFKLIAADLTKRYKLDADWKKIQQFNFAENLERDGSTTMSFIIEETKERAVRVLWIYFTLI